MRRCRLARCSVTWRTRADCGRMNGLERFAFGFALLKEIRDPTSHGGGWDEW